MVQRESRTSPSLISFPPQLTWKQQFVFRSLFGTGSLRCLFSARTGDNRTLTDVNLSDWQEPILQNCHTLLLKYPCREKNPAHYIASKKMLMMRISYSLNRRSNDTFSFISLLWNLNKGKNSTQWHNNESPRMPRACKDLAKACWFTCYQNLAHLQELTLT